MNISKKNSKGRGAVDESDFEDEIDGEEDGEEGEEPSLDALPYREELAMCSPAMRELEEGVAEDMAGYMEERI